MRCGPMDLRDLYAGVLDQRMNHDSAERHVFTTVKTSPTIHPKAVPYENESR